MWDFIYFFKSFIQWVLVIMLTPIIGYSLFLYMFGKYIWKSLLLGYFYFLGGFLTFSYSFFEYLLIFLYFFSAGLWGGVILNKNFNLKHLSNNGVGSYCLFVSLAVKNKYTCWYYYFIYYII